MLKHFSMTIHPTYYLYSSGGLGDVFKDYLTSPAWLKVIELKKRYAVDLQVLLRTTCKLSEELFSFNPYFSKVNFQDFRGNQAKLYYPRLQENDFYFLDNKTMPIFLSQQELDMMDKIQHPFIALHPYAGEDFRAWDKRLNLQDFIFDLKKRGFNVVLLGGNHFRDAAIEDQRFFREEIFDYKQEGFYNFVGAGVRLCLSAVERADYVIGSSSAYTTAAWCLNKKTMSIVPDGQFLEVGNWWYDVLYDKSTVVRFSDLSRIESTLHGFLCQ